MVNHLKIRHRRSIRLPNYNYRNAGLYFVTICTFEKHHFFGEVRNSQMILNEVGQTASDCWLQIPIHFPQTKSKDFVVMPNHIHGIIEIVDIELIAKTDPYRKDFYPSGTSQTLGSIVRGYKTGVTQWVRQHTNITDIWQRNYHEHIIRDHQSYLKIAEYIQTNPQNWLDDIYCRGE